MLSRQLPGTPQQSREGAGPERSQSPLLQQWAHLEPGGQCGALLDITRICKGITAFSCCAALLKWPQDRPIHVVRRWCIHIETANKHAPWLEQGRIFENAPRTPHKDFAWPVYLSGKVPVPWLICACLKLRDTWMPDQTNLILVLRQLSSFANQDLSQLEQTFIHL